MVLPRAHSTFQERVPPIWPDICALAKKSATMLPLSSRHLQRLGWLGGSRTGLSTNGTVSQSSWRASGQQPWQMRDNMGNGPCFPCSCLLGQGPAPSGQRQGQRQLQGTLGVTPACFGANENGFAVRPRTLGPVMHGTSKHIGEQKKRTWKPTNMPQIHYSLS